MSPLPVGVDMKRPSAVLALLRLQDGAPLTGSQARVLAQCCGAEHLTGRMDLAADLEEELAVHPDLRVRQAAGARDLARRGRSGVWGLPDVLEYDDRSLWWLRTAPAGAQALDPALRGRLPVSFLRPAALNPATDLSGWTADDVRSCLFVVNVNAHGMPTRVVLAHQLVARASHVHDAGPMLGEYCQWELPAGFSDRGLLMMQAAESASAAAAVAANPLHAGPAAGPDLPWKALLGYRYNPFSTPGGVLSFSAFGAAVRLACDQMASLPDGPQVVDALTPAFDGTVSQMLTLMKRVAQPAAVPA